MFLLFPAVSCLHIITIPFLGAKLFYWLFTFKYLLNIPPQSCKMALFLPWQQKSPLSRMAYYVPHGQTPVAKARNPAAKEWDSHLSCVGLSTRQQWPAGLMTFGLQEHQLKESFWLNLIFLFILIFIVWLTMEVSDSLNNSCHFTESKPTMIFRNHGNICFFIKIKKWILFYIISVISIWRVPYLFAWY